MPESAGTNRARAYTQAGVDIEAGNTLVKNIKDIVASTHTQGVLSDIGGFGGLFKPDIANMEEPVLVASTDGVGTKLKLAFAFNKHDTVGIDLVAMSANDVLVQGAKPLFFLDYFATGKLDIEVAQAVITGVAHGCKLANCALLGGETAEMPDMYPPGEYDLAGFCVGLVDNQRLVDGSSIKHGDRIIGIASSGPHSNGYSLIRKIFDASGHAPMDILPGSNQTFAEALLAPTNIYVDCVRNLMRDTAIAGMCHITGGGFYDNIPRVLPQHTVAIIDFNSWDIPPVFTWLHEAGKLSWPEMLQIFNCGVGFVLVVDEKFVDEIIGRVQAQNLAAWDIGHIAPMNKEDAEQVEVLF